MNSAGRMDLKYPTDHEHLFPNRKNLESQPLCLEMGPGMFLELWS